MRQWLFRIGMFIFVFGMIIQIIPNASSDIDTDESNIDFIFYSSYNNQTLTSSRLNNINSDFFLPRYLGEIELSYTIDSDHLEIQPNIEIISLRTDDGFKDIEVYRAQLIKEPTVWNQIADFSIFIQYTINGEILLNEVTGQVVMTMPDDFIGGTLFTMIKYSQMFIEGALKTIILALVGTIVGFVLALILAIMKLQKADVHDSKFVKFIKIILYKFSTIYITLFRGTPMIVQASFFWYGFGLFGDPFYCGLFVVSINTAAYIAEILRGGVQSIDQGQSEAAQSLGMNQIQTMIYIIFPQAIKNSLPAIGNEFIVNIKDTAVLSVIGIFELFNQGRKITGMHYRQLEVYLIVALIYLFLTYTISEILKRVEIKMNLQPLEIASSN